MNSKLEKALLEIAKKLKSNARRMRALDAMSEIDNAEYCEFLAKELQTPAQHEAAVVVARSYGYDF